MPKSPKSHTTRKPPEPSDRHADIQAWIAGSMPGMQPLLKALDKQIRDAIPGLQYGVKWSKAYYGTPELGWVIELAGYHVSVNAVFFAGARFDPPPPLGEGSRYVKLRSLEEATSAEVRDWIEQAGRHPGWK
jgi:hypothetical protein